MTPPTEDSTTTPALEHGPGHTMGHGGIYIEGCPACEAAVRKLMAKFGICDDDAERDRIRAGVEALPTSPTGTYNRSHKMIRLDDVLAVIGGEHAEAKATCIHCGRQVERIKSGTWADGRPMLRHVDTLQPLCSLTAGDVVAEAGGDDDDA